MLGIVEISKYVACKNNVKKQKGPLNFCTCFCLLFSKTYFNLKKNDLLCFQDQKHVKLVEKKKKKIRQTKQKNRNVLDNYHGFKNRTM